MRNETKAEAAPAQVAQHTPGPWHYQQNTDAYTHIVRDSEERYVCGCSQDSKGNAKANAAFIVRACNCHEELLQALQELLNRNEIMLGYNLRGETETRWTDKQSISRPGEIATWDALTKTMQQARSALAKAQGGQP